MQEEIDSDQDSLSLTERLEDQQAACRAVAILEFIRQDPSRLYSFQSFVDELIEEGEVDPLNFDAYMKAQE